MFFNFFSPRVYIKDEPEPFIIVFLAKKLRYTPKRLARLFHNPQKELFKNKMGRMKQFVQFWNVVVRERKNLKKKDEKK